MFYKSLITVLILSLTLSCSDGLLDTFDRVTGDPEIVEPIVKSFTDKGVIDISWDNDNRADEYVLYRSEDISNPDYEEVYRGLDTEYLDTSIIEGNCYLYVLCKVRGTKLFGPSESVLGVCSQVKEDELEDNNSKDKATELVWDLDANLYYYESVTGANTWDDDWYYIEVPPRRTANILVTQHDRDSAQTTDLMFAVEGSIETTVINSSAEPISNTSYITKTFYILISPKNGVYLDDNSQGGGKVVTYTISFVSIVNL